MKRVRSSIAAIGAALVGLSLTAGTAAAVDLNRPIYKVQKPTPAPVYNWTGFYLGGGGGYGWYDMENDLRFATGAPIINTTKGKGWFGTAMAGIDNQFAERWVAGVFGDYDWASLKGDHDLRFDTIGTLKMSSAWAAGVRLGYLVSPTTLFYGTAGYTQAKFDEVTFRSNDGDTLFVQPAQKFQGWFLGAGAETQLGNNWAARIEYRYADYSSNNLTIINATPHTYTQDPVVQTIRAGLTYKFTGSR